MVSSQKPINLRHRTSWATITLALVLIFVTTACAFPEETFDGSLDGEYYVNGFDHQGTEYGGSLIVIATDTADVYEMEWIITGAIQTGIGTVSGDQLAVEWEALEGFDTSSHGTALYTITTDGELIGERSVSGQEGVGSEEAFPVK